MATTRKKPVSSKKVTTKKPSSIPRRSKKVQKDTPRSFRLAQSDQPFLTFRATKQTVYWTIIGIVLIAFGIWIYKLDSDVRRLYDQIDQSTVTNE